MFLKMLKSEMKQNKGLNSVLLIFMAIASVLVFAGAVQIYTYLTGTQYSREMSRSSDITMILNSRNGRIDSRRLVAEKVLDENENVLGHSRLEMTEFRAVLIDFDGIDEKTDHSFTEKWHFFTVMPEEYDMVFDLEDKPFTVPNGCAALPASLKSITGAKVGDKFRITTEMGNIYELTVCGFFKDQVSENFRYIISDDDYKVISADSYYVSDLYSITLDKTKPDSRDLDKVTGDIRKALDENNVKAVCYYTQKLTNESVMMMIVSVFVVLISIFMILIILMTIRFTIIAALKEEEKEIGMMRAMGVDSFGFRWLFSAKYIGFSFIGGIVGIIGGVYVSRLLLGIFSPNVIAPPLKNMLFIGSVSVLAISAVMILFSLGVMRRINRISVIDAIHGENRGERFGSSAVIFLHKRSRMPVPLYLAVSDILKRFKRYLFLLVAYTLGVSIMLITVNLRNSVISEQFICYSSCYSFDFSIDFTDPHELEILYKRIKSSGMTTYDIINEDMRAAGIPAEIDLPKITRGKLLIGDCEIGYEVYSEGARPERYTYRKGGTAPKLKNEIALSYYTASRYGLQVGDTIEMMLFENTADKMSGEYHKKQLVITGFIDAVESNGGICFAIMGDEYTDGFSHSRAALSRTIYTDESEKDAVIARIQELYPGFEVLNGKQHARRYLAEYDRIFALLEYIMSGTVIFVSALMTYLYMHIFIAEETREIALLKSMGFTDGSIRAWQMIRLLILTAAAAVIAIIFVKTAGTLFIRKLFEFLPLTGFSFLPEYLFSFCIIPLGALITISLSALTKLSCISRISVNRINEE